ncbi:hypothetical protein ES703_47878 [subsurface metagenome]
MTVTGIMKAEISIGEESYPMTGELATIFRLLSNSDAVKILSRAGQEIRNSTYTMEELGLSQKRYYYRLNELVAADLIKKVDGVYKQTTLGKIMCGHFLPAMGRTYAAKDELELLMRVEGTEMEPKVRQFITDELGIPGFAESSNIKILGDYEDLAVTAMDLYDSAEESVLLASNYFDVRIIEAFFRTLDRDITNRVIMGKNRRSTMIQNLRMMLSVTFAKTLIDFASNTVELKNTVRFAELPYTFCIVDGHHNIIEISDTLNEGFIVALLIDDRGVGERLTKFHNTLWEAGEFHSAIEGFNSFNSS